MLITYKFLNYPLLKDTFSQKTNHGISAKCLLKLLTKKIKIYASY